jgi:hypothetical protein
MIRLRVLFGVLAAALVICGLSLGDDPAPRARGTLPPNWKKIGLEPAQVQKIYKIQSEYRGKIEALEVQIRKLRADERAEMEKVLTKAQKDRLKELREQGPGGTSTKPDTDAGKKAGGEKIK